MCSGSVASKCERHVDGAGIAGIAAVDGTEHHRTVLDRAADRADLVERPAQAIAPVRLHAAEGRSQAGRAAAHARRGDRAVGFGADGEPAQARAVAAAEPALDPLDPCCGSTGCCVRPPNQMSLYARAPSDSLATSTAPAASSRLTTVASVIGHAIRERLRAPGRGDAGGIQQVLRARGDAMQRTDDTCPPAISASASCGQGARLFLAQRDRRT